MGVLSILACIRLAYSNSWLGLGAKLLWKGFVAETLNLRRNFYDTSFFRLCQSLLVTGGSTWSFWPRKTIGSSMAG